MKKIIIFLFGGIFLTSAIRCNEINSSLNISSSSTEFQTEDLLELATSLEDNNRLIRHAIQHFIKGMEITVQVKIGYQDLVAKAREVDAFSKNFSHEIDLLINDLWESSEEGYVDKRTNTPIKHVSNTDKKSPNDLFVLGNASQGKAAQGPILEKKILELRKYYLKSVEKLWENDGVKGTIFADPSKKSAVLAELEQAMPMTNPEINQLNIPKEQSWTEYTFGNKSALAAYVLLRKIENSAILSEEAVVKLLRSQMGMMELGTDRFNIIVHSTKPYVSLGENYEAEIVIGDYEKNNQSVVKVNGRILKNAGGKYIYKDKPKYIGEKKYTAEIAVKNPLTGETETFTKEFSYKVIK